MKRVWLHCSRTRLPERDSVREVYGIRGRIEFLAYRCADRFPGLIDWLAAEDTRINLEDSGQYFRNADGIGDRIRDVLRVELQRCWAAGERVLLMTHSFGSVIAWDTLWSLQGRGWPDRSVPDPRQPARHALHPAPADEFQGQGPGCGTLSPRYPSLAQPGGDRRSDGTGARIRRRFRGNAGAWAWSPGSAIETDLLNPYRDADGLNVHKCYGYFVNAATGEAIARWWRDLPVSSAPTGLPSV